MESINVLERKENNTKMIIYFFFAQNVSIKMKEKNHLHIRKDTGSIFYSVVAQGRGHTGIFATIKNLTNLTVLLICIHNSNWLLPKSLNLKALKILA